MIAISAGFALSVALKSDGKVVAWGRNQYGETNVPENLTGVMAIAAGYFHILALKSDGTVVAWGANLQGQTTVPTNLTGVIAIAAGGYHSLALKSDGTVVAWGRGGPGQTGDLNYGQSTVPENLTGVIAIAAGFYHSLALKSDGTVVAWGSNSKGQTTVSTNLTGVIAIAAGDYHCLALRSDGTVVAWGSNDNGESGVPTNLTGVIAIAAGFNHSLALLVPPTQNQVPHIVTQPQRQTAIAGANVTLRLSVSGPPPLSYQWRKSEVNIPGATSATLTLNTVGASASGGYSVVVWNAYGSVVSDTASLAVLADGANGIVPEQLVALDPPTPDPAQDSLVVVTHGWMNAWKYPFGPPSGVPWVNGLANKISQRLVAEGKNNWQVVPYLWTQDAWSFLPQMAAGGGSIVGYLYGLKLGDRVPPWKHVHLIGHSAGSALIESAAAAIKTRSPTTEIHTTFLDPFVGVTTVRKLVYGTSANWSDNYYAHDFPTYYTTEAIPRAYNVDVSWVDPDKKVTQGYDSDFASVNSSCVALSSHKWPHDFYSNSVVNALEPCAAPYGFALSKEGGGWDNRANYPRGNSAPPPCRDCLPPVMQDMPLHINEQINLNLSAYATSPAGVSAIDLSGFKLNMTIIPPPEVRAAGDGPDGDSFVPAWLAVGVPVTNSVNFVQFDAAFTGTNGAEGLVTVYWNTNQIGMLDERVGSPGFEAYRFVLPGTVTNGLYTLSFRLDSFNGTMSSVTVTNVATGFAGLDKPFRLDMLPIGSNNAPVLKLTAPINYSYLVESSTNLLDWKPTALLLNAKGTMYYADPAVTNSGARFYRAALYSYVNLTSPTLTATRQNNGLVLSWPTNFVGFALEYATNLLPASWTSNSALPSVVNGQYTVTNVISGGAKFYRLKK